MNTTTTTPQRFFASLAGLILLAAATHLARSDWRSLDETVAQELARDYVGRCSFVLDDRPYESVVEAAAAHQGTPIAYVLSLDGREATVSVAWQPPLLSGVPARLGPTLRLRIERGGFAERFRWRVAETPTTLRFAGPS